jgi:hypothetical protein
MSIAKISLLVLSIAFVYKAGAQGCSDAGFCSIGSFKPGKKITHGDSIARNILKIGVGYGAADNNIGVIGSYVEYQRAFSNKFSISGRLTSLAQNGNDISAFGLSDLLLSGNIGLTKEIGLTAGIKVPLQQGNKTKNNLALPMDYQASLGTVDFLVGLSYNVKNWKFAAGLQQPLTQNDNQFLATSYASTSPLSKFSSTRKFKRAGDVLVRASYSFKASDKFTITPSLLPIVHIGNDSYVDAAGVTRTIEGSDGATLNGNIFLNYAVSKKAALELVLGAPFAVREVRPDGLTRKFVAGLELKLSL